MKPRGKNHPVAPAPTRRPRRLVAAALGLALAMALGGAFFSYRNRVSAASLARHYADPSLSQITLDPQSFDGEARESYRIAREQPVLLAKLHCYCHCDEKLGHRNLLDCYRDNHAASCGICMGEARDAAQMSKQGTSVDEIRDTLRARYENQE
jgi:hypothetical protein